MMTETTGGEWCSRAAQSLSNFIWNVASDPSGSFAQRYGALLNREDEWLGVGRELFLRYSMGLGAWHMYGSYDTVAQHIQALHEAGIESILTCFFDPIRGLHQMEDDVIPLLKKMGLRR